VTTQQLQDTFVTRLIDEIFFPFTADDLGDIIDLTDNGVIDSMGIVEILELIEDIFGIHIDEVNVKKIDFRSLDSIMALIADHS
jgi:acyl carrier protein